MNHLDHQFHRAQALIKSNALKASFKGQNTVAPNFLDAQFHRAQTRLKSKALRSPLAQKAVEPFFTGLAAKHNDQRIAEYEQRMARYTGVAA